ncbi:MAG TPA: SPFH domain-containing protein [Kouleothrix sp.]|uniref:SPFH domain-containing protein n=1 Tax=Kouleothrix sp. TaxID=2779161 RepID=UPI002BDD4335|nr:SPFH domain-containing protein [Kouleothrix sp.]HRC75521.1 SPFH domain-containing protein [Kouleothrix sp.]
MAIKNVATSAVLGLLFVSLVVIYLLIPTNNLVLFLSVLIMLVSLIVAQSRSWREIGVMAGFAALMSLVAATLLGRALFGTFGTVLGPVVWLLALLAMFSWTQRNMLTVPRERAILIANRYTGAVREADGPIAPPLAPGVEVKLAELPLYELNSDVQIDKINTRARHNVDMIKVHLEYRVRDKEGRKVLSGIPNRSQAEAKVADELKKPLGEARQEVVYWEKLIDRQMQAEAEDVVRAVIFNNVTAQNVIEIYNNREALADMVRERLSGAVRRWGIELLAVDFERIDFNPDIAKGINKANVREDETLLEKIKAEREATRIRLTGTAQAEAEAVRVAEMVKALRETGVELSPEALRDIVVDAIHAAADAYIDNGVLRS